MKIRIPAFLLILLDKEVTAITLWPFVFYRNRVAMKDELIWRHELIHLRQQLELLVIPFYVVYVLEYFYWRIKLANHRAAYRSISFEKEAYRSQNEVNYLQHRLPFAMWRR